MCDATVWAPQKERHSQGNSASRRGDIFMATIRSTPWRAKCSTKRPQRFALAGHSMGGRVALEIMRTAPKRVRGLALFDTTATPATPDEPEQAARNDRPCPEARHGRACRALVTHDRASRNDLNEREFMKALTAMICRATPRIFAGQIKAALISRPDYRPLLPQIACPMLVACGRDDLWSPIAPHEEIAAANPRRKTRDHR